ncbi:hypothetical protein HYH03_017595 [Edaphochlamys debaryana]|uniref:RBR-type E3 ubiquitin transferase n=1 Tax=Edaphochlamys debaryana TaxID=47281 RepID=A0A835XGX6_9CHLO|nr:hypothetical protein HYH03_017595 [Edaphochlamys debaryana]|eukprot:KAG2483541.1 hypothetical protein HYH03_017595 [Edaphochlamys debaryana]
MDDSASYALALQLQEEDLQEQLRNLEEAKRLADAHGIREGRVEREQQLEIAREELKQLQSQRLQMPAAAKWAPSGAGPSAMPVFAMELAPESPHRPASGNALNLFTPATSPSARQIVTQAGPLIPPKRVGPAVPRPQLPTSSGRPSPGGGAPSTSRATSATPSRSPATAAPASARNSPAPPSSSSSGSGASSAPASSSSAASSASSTSSAPATSSGPTSANPVHRVRCVICGDRLPKAELVFPVMDPSPQPADSGTRVKACRHGHCASCLEGYCLSAVETGRSARVRCTKFNAPPAGEGCAAALPWEAVRTALASSAKLLEVFEDEVAKAAAMTPGGQEVFCPHRGCGAPFERPPDSELPQDQPTNCPACNRGFCPRCRSRWHTGFTCTQYQALPPARRAALEGDLDFQEIVKEEGLKPCPGCGQVVQKTEGCNHMTCKPGCGVQFCYFCGKRWKQSETNSGAWSKDCPCDFFELPPGLQHMDGTPLRRPPPRRPREPDCCDKALECGKITFAVIFIISTCGIPLCLCR